MAHDSRFRSEANVDIELDTNGNAPIDPFFLPAMGAQAGDPTFTPSAAGHSDARAGSDRPDFRNVLSADLPVIADGGPVLAPTPERWAEVEARVTRRTKETPR